VELVINAFIAGVWGQVKKVKQAAQQDRAVENPHGAT
jgi:hypothetical protein